LKSCSIAAPPELDPAALAEPPPRHRHRIDCLETLKSDQPGALILRGASP